MKQYTSEFIGTFALVFCGTGAVIINQETNGAIGQVGVAITFGLIVLTMIYTFGKTSGAHFNPAVTIAFFVAGKFKKEEVFPYLVSQLTGAFLATIILKLLFSDNKDLGATIPAGSCMQSFVLEFILTYILMLVIIQVSSGPKEIGVMAGIAIGATVLLEAMFAGPISGASMNPARSIAPALVSGELNNLWIYILAPISGAICSVLTWKLVLTDKR